MSALDDIRTAADATRDAIDTAKNAVMAAIAEADDKADRMAGLGLQGVWATVNACRDSLEAAASGLGSAHDTADGAVNALAGVTDETGTDDTIAQLDPVISQYVQTTSGIDTAQGCMSQYAQQSQIDGLIAVVGAVFDNLSGARNSVGDAAGKTQAYRAQVEAASSAGN